MKHTISRFTFAALLPILLLTACMEQSEDTSGLEARINYVGVRQTAGQYQLGLDYTLTGNTGDTEVAVYIDGQRVTTGLTDGRTGGLTKSAVQDGVVFVDVPNPGTENHTVYIAASDASGQQAASEEKAWSRSMRTSLVEIITSANCTPCAPANEEYHLRTASAVAKLRLATVKYHVWWPRPTDSLYKHSKSWVEPRVKNYLPLPQTWVAPTGFVNGMKTGAKAGDWVTQADIDFGIPAGAEIILTSIDNGSTVDVGITVRGISSGQYSDLRLYTLVTESSITYNDGNAESVHYEVMKRMLPDAGGEQVSIPNGQEVAFTRVVTIEPGEIKDNMSVVVFLQSEGTKEVLQAATIEF